MHDVDKSTVPPLDGSFRDVVVAVKDSVDVAGVVAIRGCPDDSVGGNSQNGDAVEDLVQRRLEDSGGNSLRGVVPLVPDVAIVTILKMAEVVNVGL